MRLVLFVSLFFFSFSCFSQVFDRSITVGVSPLYSYRNLRNGDGSQSVSNVIASRNSYEEPLLSYGIFVGYNHKISKRFSLGGELKYQRLGFRTDIKLDSLRPRQPNDPLIPTSIEFDDIFHISSLYINNYYTFLKKENSDVYAVGGLGMDVLLDHYIKRKTDKTSQVPDLAFEGKQINVSAKLGLGAIYKLNDHSAISTSLGYHLNILDFNTNPVRLRLVYFGLNIGYVISL
ncbi:MAG: hypothetical protein ACN6I4_01475 [bacterium]